MLIRDKMLVFLNWRDMGFHELAITTGEKLASLKSSNGHNMAMGYTEWVEGYNHKRPHDNRLRITRAGRIRLVQIRDNQIKRPRRAS